ncbi:uncharacterized protein LOC119840454 [Zerene cesonia]|uniref:uncharacterized protein LOC119840454 n=1 Tax=Zerene cesonia TaxID=33412 RepID=UPI0018E52BA9|nr:uncharacterized protein LOC119840454 [Zerene cesonia]
MALKVFFCLLIVVPLIRGEADYIQPPQSEVPRLLEISINCVSETGVDSDTLFKLMTWTFKKTPNTSKFMYCFLTKAGFADSEGQFVKDTVVRLVGNHKRKDEFANVIEECNKTPGKDKFDRLYRVVGCAHDKSPILFSI